MWQIDTFTNDDNTMYVTVPSHKMTVCIKLEMEGIAVDVYPCPSNNFRDASVVPIATLTAKIIELVEGDLNGI